MRPPQMATTVHLSLLRIANSRIAKRRVFAIEIDLAFNVRSQTALALRMSETGGGLRRFDRFIEFAGFSVSGGERSNEKRIRLIRNAVEPEREFYRGRAISKGVIRSGREEPGEVV